MTVVNQYMCQTRSGRYLDYSNPTPEMFTIEDIAIGLSRECRFSGQTSLTHSVAAHSVLVSLVVPKEYALMGLMHDGSEAFMRDISTPLKRLLPDYRKYEELMQDAVYAMVGIRNVTEEQSRVIKEGDMKIFATERKILMTNDNREWPDGKDHLPLSVTVGGMAEREAYEYFMDRYDSIINDRPFEKEMDLWKAQHNDWLLRNSHMSQSAPKAMGASTQSVNQDSRGKSRQRVAA